MSYIQRIGAAALALCILVVPAQAADRAKLEAFMEITGFDISLEGMRQSAKTAPAMLGLSADDFGIAWTIAADQVFDPDALMTDALDILEHTMSDETLDHAAAFYASDLGQRLVAVENASHMADSDVKQEQGALLAADLMEQGSLQPDLFLRMADAVGAMDHSINSYREVQVRFIMSAQSAGAFDRGFSEEELRAVLSAQDAEIKDAMKADIIASSAYTYRDFSDDDMVAYLDALSQPQMREAYDLMNAIHYTIMARCYEELAKRLADMSPSQSL